MGRGSVERPEIELPGWLAEANRLLGQRSRPVLVDDWPQPPQVGDVRVAEAIRFGQGRPRLACVVAVDRRVGAATFALVSNEVEMASRGDVVVPGSGCGLPFDLLVETRNLGSLWWTQLSRLVGRLEGGWIDRVLRAVNAPPEHEKKTIRPAGESPGAIISEFHRSETAELQVISASCQASLQGGVRGVPVVVDPQVLAGRPAESASRHDRRLVQVARELVGSRTTVVPREGLGDVLSACEASQHFDRDLAVSLRPLLEGALSGLSFDPVEQGVDFEPRGRRMPGEAEGTLAGALQGLAAAEHGSVRLVTDHGAWAEEATDQPGPVACRIAGGDRLQIARHFVEVLP